MFAALLHVGTHSVGNLKDNSFDEVWYQENMLIK